MVFAHEVGHHCRYPRTLVNSAKLIQRLRALDTHAIEPTASVLPLRSVMREDVSRAPLARDDILANAPASDDGCFVVPRVLDRED